MSETGGGLKQVTAKIDYLLSFREFQIADFTKPIEIKQLKDSDLVHFIECWIRLKILIEITPPSHSLSALSCQALATNEANAPLNVAS